MRRRREGEKICVTSPHPLPKPLTWFNFGIRISDLVIWLMKLVSMESAKPVWFTSACVSYTQFGFI
jgi:hypothetical protein